MSAGHSHRLTSRLDVESPTVSAEFQLIFTVINASDRDVWVLEWNTPLEGLLGDVLRVSCDDDPLEYRGKVVKRGRAPASAWRHLPPASSTSERFRLGDAYEWEGCRRLSVAVDALARVSFTPPGDSDDIKFVELTTEPVRLVT